MTHRQKRAWKLYAKALRLSGSDFSALVFALDIALQKMHLNEGLVYIKPLGLFIDREGNIYVVKKGKQAEKLTIIRQKSENTEQQHRALWPISLISRKT